MQYKDNNEMFWTYGKDGRHQTHIKNLANKGYYKRKQRTITKNLEQGDEREKPGQKERNL